MNKFRSMHIRRCLFLYLAIMLFTTMVISVILYVGIVGPLATATPNARITSSDPNSAHPIPSLGSGLKMGLMLILAAGLLVNAGLGYVWYRITARKLEQPVRIILRALEQLARGQLNETVSIDTPDEFVRMGAGINELAANLQELLLYIWKQTGQCLTLLEHIQNNPDLRHDRRLNLESLGHLKQLAESIDDLREMAKSYVFYDVSLDGNKTHAISQPGEKHPAGHMS